jgi:hypothetical protein
MAIFVLLALFLGIGLFIRSFTIRVRLLLFVLIIGVVLYSSLT